MKGILLCLQILAAEPQEETSDFDFYLEELVSHELETNAPMSQLIIQNLSEAIFDTDSAEIFHSRIQALKNVFINNPRRADRFIALNRALEVAYSKKIKEAKRVRLIYTAAGVVVGALIGIPIGKAVGGSGRILLITVPIAGSIGAGAGFLLGNLLALPEYEFDSSILEIQLKELEQLD